MTEDFTAESNEPAPSSPERAERTKALVAALKGLGKFTIAILFIALADFLFRLAATLLLATDSNFYRDFMTSPGAAGVAAVVAATIASVAVTRQLRQNRLVEHRKSWWATFEWTVERTLPESTSRQYPMSWALKILESMVLDPLVDSNQKGACSATVDHFSGLMSEQRELRDPKDLEGFSFDEPEISATSEAASPEEPPTFREAREDASARPQKTRESREMAGNILALREYVAATGTKPGSAGRSVVAENFLFERDAGEFLSRVAGALGGTYSEALPPHQYQFDGWLEIGDSTILVEFIHGSAQTVIRKIPLITKIAARESSPVIIVSPYNLQGTLHSDAPRKVWSIQYRRGADFEFDNAKKVLLEIVSGRRLG